MNIPAEGWKNRKGLSDKRCPCGSWQEHWQNFSGKHWPSMCSVEGCLNEATCGGYVSHPLVGGEKIVPMCDSCNNKGFVFSLKGGVSLINANKYETCST